MGATAALPKEVKDVASGIRRPLLQEESGGRGRERPDRRRKNNAPSPQVPGEASLMGRELCPAHQTFALGLHHGLLQEVALGGLYRALLSGPSWKEMAGMERED